MLRSRRNSKDKSTSVRRIALKIFLNDKMVYSIFSGTFVRFRNSILKRKGDKFKIVVGYGRATDCFGSSVDFYNDGVYTDRNEALVAFDAFIEK